MKELLLVYDEEKGCWTERKEPFATVKCQTEEDYNYLVAAVEFYKDKDKYVEQKHGWWEQCFEDWRKQIEGDKCSACGFEHYGCSINHFHFCPNCGAKMDGE